MPARGRFFDDDDNPTPTTPGERGPTVTSGGSTGLSEQEQYVNGLYLSLMGRPATAGELRTWVGRNVSLPALAERLRNSEEGRRHAALVARGRVPTVQTFGGATQTPTSGSTTAFSESALQEILRRYPPTNEGIRQAIDEANQTFGTSIGILDHPERLDKIRLPDGRVIDVIIGATGTGGQWGWLDDSGGGAGRGMTGDLQAPWGETFSFGSFAAPTAEEARQNPGFKFALDEGLKALERSRAASGTYLNPATAKALNEFAHQAADINYANVYNRELGEYQQARGNALQEYLERRNVFETNRDQSFSKLFDFSQLGAQSASNLGAIASQYGTSIADLISQGANAQASGGIGASNAWSNFFGGLGNTALSLYAQDRFFNPRGRRSRDGD